MKIKKKREQVEKQKEKVNFPKWHFLFLMVLIAIITLVLYSHAFENKFTNWDDNTYIFENNLLKSLDFVNIKSIFSTKVMANYHPLTILSYALEYHFFKFNPFVYHFDNVLIHLLNSLLLFGIVFLLSGKLNIAFVTSLLFSIHPMHVESVAWVSERKDVLYTFFYLLAWLSYLSFIRADDKSRKLPLLILTGILFLFSLLCKGQAVSLTLILMLSDYVLNRKFSRTLVYEKIPFLVLSIIFGIIALKVQHTAGAIHDVNLYSFFERACLAAYALVLYFYKFFIPINLSCFNPYPLQEQGYFSWMIYASPIIICAFLFLLFKKFKLNRIAIFGFLFFFANIILVLQLIPIGDAIIAERYTYLSYIGLFFIVGHSYNYLDGLSSKALFKYKYVLKIGFTSFLLLLMSISWNRIKVWHDNVSLWSDVISKYPQVWIAYGNRANDYSDKGAYDLAINDYNKAIEIHPSYEKAYFNRGNIYKNLKKNDLAIADYSQAAKYLPNWSSIYVNRGFVLNAIGEFTKAIEDYDRVLKLDTGFTEIYFNRGLSNQSLGRQEEAIDDFNKVLKKKPDWEEVVYCRALSYFSLDKLDLAMNDFTHTILINPKSFTYYGARASARNRLGLYKDAIEDFSIAINLQSNDSRLYYNRAISYKSLGIFDLALKDYQQASNLGLQAADVEVVMLSKQKH